MTAEPALCSRCSTVTDPKQILGACPVCQSKSALIPWSQLAPDLQEKFAPHKPTLHNTPGR